jgi:hypothetical protein
LTHQTAPAGANRWALDGRAGFGITNINGGGTVTFNGSSLAVPSTSTRSLAGRFFVSYGFGFGFGASFTGGRLWALDRYLRIQSRAA